MSIGRVNYGNWALRVLTWDALLPTCITFLPIVVKYLFPNRREILEVIAVTLPIVALLLRFRSGKRRIESNRCSSAFQTFQLCIFCLGILPLVLFDCIMILSGVAPQGAWFQTKEELNFLAILLSLYFIPMVIAMYPGRTQPSPDNPDDFYTYK